MGHVRLLGLHEGESSTASLFLCPLLSLHQACTQLSANSFLMCHKLIGTQYKFLEVFEQKIIIVGLLLLLVYDMN